MKRLHLLFFLLFSNLVMAQTVKDTTQTLSSSDKQALAQIANNPMANAYKIFSQNITNFGDQNSNILMNNVMVPLTIGDKVRMINRVILPVDSRGDGTTAYGNMQYQMILSGTKPIKIGEGSLILGGGPSVLMNTNTYENKRYGDDNWGVGVSLLGVYKNKGFMGLFNASPTWGVGGDATNSAMLQYMLSYTFKSGTQIISSPVIMYDETLPGDQDWVVPFGIGVGQMFKVGGKLPVNASVVCNYNAIRPDVMENNKWQLGVNLMIILPSPKLVKAMKMKKAGLL